ncbi:AraC family transcriptional regulator [Propionibacteriaceae bacterium Y2011]|uniref:helix-turn-helix transcriptional regulator n=1 Tax=Microlunatus sp. Y2014 TaxID=3418488 RepID=UPI003B46BB1E
MGTLDAAAPLSVNAAGHFHYRRSWVTDRSDPDDHLLIWVTGGSMDVTVAGVRHQAGPGDLVALHPHVPHRYRPTSTEWEWFWLHADGPVADRWWPVIATRDAPVRRFGDSAAVRERFAELVTATSTAGLTAVVADGATSRPVSPTTGLLVDSCAHSVLGLVLAQLDRPSVTPPAGLAGLTRWVTEHLAEPITVTDLAAVAGWSPAHLHRLMRRELGVAPMQFVTRLRMERAERLLLDTRLAVAEVARLVGFEDPLHFSRRFRQLTGRPPSAGRVRRVRSEPSPDAGGQ